MITNSVNKRYWSIGTFDPCSNWNTSLQITDYFLQLKLNIYGIVNCYIRNYFSSTTAHDSAGQTLECCRQKKLLSRQYPVPTETSVVFSPQIPRHVYSYHPHHLYPDKKNIPSYLIRKTQRSSSIVLCFLFTCVTVLPIATNYSRIFDAKMHWTTAAQS